MSTAPYSAGSPSVSSQGQPSLGMAKRGDSVRQEVRQLLGPIAELVRSDISPEEFYPEFLKRTATALGACRGIVWRSVGSGEFTILTEVHLASGEWVGKGDPEANWPQQSWHQELLKQAVKTPLAAPPQPVPSAVPATGSKNPTPWLLLLAPMGCDGEPPVVVELFQEREARFAAPKQLRLLAQMSELANRYFRRRRTEQLQKEAVFWQQLEEFAQQVHARLDLSWTASTLANEGRRLIGCDRLTVLAAETDRVRILAVSGQADFDPRSLVVRLMRRLVQAVLQGKEPLYYTGQTEGLAPEIQTLVENYVDRTHTKVLAIVPLWPSEELRPSPSGAEGAESVGSGEGSAGPESLTQLQPIGALVVEQFEAGQIAEGMRSRMIAVARHGQTALSHCLQYHGIFLRPLWEALGRHGWVVWARTMPRWLWAFVGGTLLAAFLLLTPARLEMEARGTLQPVIQQDVFAGVDGRVEKVLVAHRDRVQGPDLQTGRPGTLLCVLRNYELEEELARLTGERATLEERLAALSRSLLERQLSTVEMDRLSAEQASVRQRLQSLETQLALCRRKQEQLSIYSPIPGEVITWDVAGLLLHRPVVRGDRLLRIAQTDGPWYIELRVPEDRIGRILQAQQKTEAPLRVRFLLAADPSRTYEGQLVQIDTNAESHPQEGRTVLAKVQIDRDQVQPLLPGSEVRARIDCGRCSLGYRWFHDLADWLRWIWFRW